MGEKFSTKGTSREDSSNDVGFIYEALKSHCIYSGSRGFRKNTKIVKSDTKKNQIRSIFEHFSDFTSLGFVAIPRITKTSNDLDLLANFHQFEPKSNNLSKIMKLELNLLIQNTLRTHFDKDYFPFPQIYISQNSWECEKRCKLQNLFLLMGDAI